MTEPQLEVVQFGAGDNRFLTRMEPRMIDILEFNRALMARIFDVPPDMLDGPEREG